MFLVITSPVGETDVQRAPMWQEHTDRDD